MNNYENWLATKEVIKELTEKLHDIEAAIWLEANEAGNVRSNGSKTYEDNGYKVTIVHKDNVKVDQVAASKHPELFRVKYDFDKRLYADMPKSMKDLIDEAITITPAKPSFRIEKMEEL